MDQKEKEITSMRQRVNEQEVEAQLHIQYKRRKLEGEQDCLNRQFEKTERTLEEEITKFRKELTTEKTVNVAIVGHLKTRVAGIKQEMKAFETKQEEEKKKFEDKTNEIKEESKRTEDNMQEI